MTTHGNSAHPSATRSRRLLRGATLLLAVGAGLLTASVSQATLPPAPPTAQQRSGGPTAATADALKAFFDGAVPGLLSADHVPGTVVSVVHGGVTAFTGGYGVADVQSGQPFDPNRSLVRIASITKLFTATAVMQQVAAGRLDLTADVNSYLPNLHIPSVDGDRVTSENLLDHTAGFEERSVGDGARSADQVAPLQTFLATDMPARIRPAGQISAYSNYGAGLSGQIVASVTGQSWGAYVQGHILDPLGMRHTTPFEPVPAALAADAAHSYDWTEGGYREIPFIFDRLPPDGAISSTATDMANFMNAHLAGENADGATASTEILDPTTLALMHQRSFSANPDLDGYAHGFHESTVAGHRALTHDGSWEGFQSMLLLVPDSDLGLFVSTNSTGGIELVTDLLDRFTGRFLAATTRPVTSSGAVSAADPADFAGYYQPARHNETSQERILTPLNTTRLSMDGSTVTFQGRPWDQIGPLLYQDRTSGQRLALVSVPDGTRYVATDGASYQLVPTTDTARTNLLLLAVPVLALLAALALPVSALTRRLRKRPAPVRGRGWMWSRRLAIASTVVGLGFVVMLFLILAGDTGDFVYGLTASFDWLLVLPLVFLVMTAGTIGLTVRSWASGSGVLSQLHQSTLIAGMLTLTWFLIHFHLVGWQH